MARAPAFVEPAALVTGDDLRRRIDAARQCGVVHLALRERASVAASSDPRAAADAIARALGFHALGTAWRELGHQEARDAIRDVLHRDLAYGGELMPETSAAAFAVEFLACFDAHARFYGNAEFPPLATRASGAPGWMGSWDPITKATFDTGVVAVGEHKVGLLWIEDED